MDSDSNADAYWRRRFIILGGGLAALAVVAWLFSGGPGPRAAQTAAARASMAARDSRTQLPAAAYGTPSPGGTPRPSAPSASGTLSPSASPGAAASGAAAASGRRGHCPSGSIVLSLFTSQASYATAQEPRFTVYAVSTAASACELTYGTAAVRVIVTRHGHVVWDSAACKLRGATAGKVLFRQGVPQVTTLSWNRKAANPGCAGSLPRGSQGTLDAVALADGRSSPVRTFRLRP